MSDNSNIYFHFSIPSLGFYANDKTVDTKLLLLCLRKRATARARRNDRTSALDSPEALGAQGCTAAAAPSSAVRPPIPFTCPRKRWSRGPRAEGKGSRMRRSMTNLACHFPCPFASQKFRRRHRIHIQIRALFKSPLNFKFFHSLYNINF